MFARRSNVQTSSAQAESLFPAYTGSGDSEHIHTSTAVPTDAAATPPLQINLFRVNRIVPNVAHQPTRASVQHGTRTSSRVHVLISSICETVHLTAAEKSGRSRALHRKTETLNPASAAL